MFPAYAGMIPALRRYKHAVNGVPRIRGDDPRHMARIHLTAECSPHTRG